MESFLMQKVKLSHLRDSNDSPMAQSLMLGSRIAFESPFFSSTVLLNRPVRFPSAQMADEPFGISTPLPTSYPPCNHLPAHEVSLSVNSQPLLSYVQRCSPSQ